MSTFSKENGYVPSTFAALMDKIRIGVNEKFGYDYTAETFIGSNWYKYAYVIAQRGLENDNKAAEIFAKLRMYIALTNEAIQRPSVSLPGLIDSFEDRGFLVSVKKNELIDAGTISIAVDLDNTAPDYAAKKIQVATLIKEFTVGGMVSKGTEVTSLTISNGQQFDFKYYLPDRKPILLRVTLTPSDNVIIAIPNDEAIRQVVFDNLNSRYRMGWDFEPQRYFTFSDAPWAATILLQYSFDAGATWLSTVYEADFDDLLEYDLEDIQVVINP